MNALTDRVLGEHVPKIESTRRGSVTNHKRLCSCGEPLPWQDWQPLYQVHLAEAIDAAIRAQIAADIEAQVPEERAELAYAQRDWRGGRVSMHSARIGAFEDAARIARGESS